MHKFRVGDYVALCDTDDPNDQGYRRYHIAKVINIADGLTQLLNYATTTRKLENAKWQPLYQCDDGAYTLTKPHKGAQQKRVIDVVETEDQGYVRVFGLKLTKTGKLTAAFRHKLARLNMKHHVLGLTYP